MGILAWIVVGLIVGFLASQVMRDGGYGLIGDIVCGRGGRPEWRLPGLDVAEHAERAVNGINIISILVAFIGAVILIAILRAVPGRRIA